jgi:hypothetical protein
MTRCAHSLPIAAGLAIVGEGRYEDVGVARAAGRGDMTTERASQLRLRVD